MNLSYIFKHLTQLADAPVRVYERAENGPWTEALCLNPNGGTKNPLPAVISDWLRKPLKSPALSCVNTAFYFSLIPFEGRRLLMGPVGLASPLQTKEQLQTEEPLETTSLCDMNLFLQATLLPWNLFSKKEMLPQELIASCCENASNVEVQRHFSQISYDNREAGNHHNAYSQEVRLLGSIERGDLKLLEQCQHEKIAGAFGTLSANQQRSIRNICISAVVLSSRAAIRGDVHPETAFSMCDSYILKIETANPLKSLENLVQGAETNFAAMVHSLQKSTEKKGMTLHHPLVEKCKNYVYDHLHGKTTLKDTAQALGIAPNYLSSLFKKYEGISFSDFVLREKITLAKELLIYSPLTYRDIAATLGFSSQSHLGEHFKKLTGMTPMQYRWQFAVTETDRP